MSADVQGPGTWLYKLARGQQMPQLVSESVATVFDTYKEWGIPLFRSSQVKLKLRIVLESTEEMTVSVDVKMHYTTYPSARIVTFFHEDNLWALKFAPHTEAYHAFVAKLHVSSAALVETYRPPTPRAWLKLNMQPWHIPYHGLQAVALT